MKGYPNFTQEDVLYKMSYVNMVMYSSVLPSYNDVKEESKRARFNEALDANNPRNFNHEPDEIIVRR